jgi:spoIIIJ-associated protein
MENRVSEVLENVLGLLVMEGSFEVNEGEESVEVIIETPDAGRLIGVGGETMDALQLLVNQIVSKQLTPEDGSYKRVVIDVGGWRKNKAGNLTKRAQEWAQEVVETGKELELDPMPAWQRRVIHMTVSEMDGVSSESVGEGRDRHLVLKPGSGSAAQQDDETAADTSES